MQSIDMRVVLAVLVLIFVAICFRNVHFPAYSHEEIMEECQAIKTKYYELQKQGAPNSQWQEFAREAQEKLDPIAEDLKKSYSKERNFFFQMVKYDLPKAIRSRGHGTRMEKAFEDLQKRLFLYEQAQERAAVARLQKKEAGKRADPLVVGILAFDGLLAVGVVYLLLPSKEAKAKKVKLGREALLRRLDMLDKKVAKNPQVAAFRGARARMRAELEMHEEALSDIDWLLERERPGVDSVALYELRDSLTEKMQKADTNVKDASTDEKQ